MEARLCDSGGARETSALLQAEDMWGDICPGKAHRGLLGYNMKSYNHAILRDLLLNMFVKNAYLSKGSELYFKHTMNPRANTDP